jgi:hypothetical protein
MAWKEYEITIGIIYESVKDVGKSLKSKSMKHNAWGICSVTLQGNERAFSIYDVTTDENAPNYTCISYASQLFDNMRIINNHNEKYVTE